MEIFYLITKSIQRFKNMQLNSIREVMRYFDTNLSKHTLSIYKYPTIQGKLMQLNIHTVNHHWTYTNRNEIENHMCNK